MVKTKCVQCFQPRKVMQRLCDADQYEGHNNMCQKGLSKIVCRLEEASDKNTVEHSKDQQRHSEKERVRIHQSVLAVYGRA